MRMSLPMNLDVLSNTYLLRGLSDFQLVRVAQIVEELAYAPGDTIIKQGAKDTDVMVILEGRVVVRGRSGESLSETGPGGILGEVALVDEAPRSATVVASVETRVAKIRSDDMWRLMEDDIVLARVVLVNLAQTLSTKLRAATLQLDLLHERN
jgi:CRP/FNR family transcriptional regulator/CRP/FNR family cyclic AMP-dependent transcriptional regulator